MPDGLHVHADLVRPPGQNVDVQQRHVPPARKHRPVRNRRAAFGVNCHFLAVFLAPRDGLVDAPAVLPQIPFNQRAVVLLHLPLLQLAAEGELALVVLCHEQQTAGVLVQPVDDAGAQFAADAAQVVKVVQERVDERAVLIAGGGVNDHAAGLQDDGEVGILIENCERDFLRDGHGGLRRGNRQDNNLTLLCLCAGFRLDFPIHCDVSIRHQRRHPRASQPSGFGQGNIQPPPVAGDGDSARFECVRHHLRHD